MCRLVPERLPNPGETMEEYQRYAGKRELVLQMIHLRDAEKRLADLTKGKRRLQR